MTRQRSLGRNSAEDLSCQRPTAPFQSETPTFASASETQTGGTRSTETLKTLLHPSKGDRSQEDRAFSNDHTSRCSSLSETVRNVVSCRRWTIFGCCKLPHFVPRGFAEVHRELVTFNQLFAPFPGDVTINLLYLSALIRQTGKHFVGMNYKYIRA